MKNHTYLDRPWGKVLFAIVFAAMLYLSRNTLVTTAILGFNRAQLLLLGLVALLGVGFLIARRREWRQIFTDSRMLLALVIAAVLLIPMVVKRDWQMMYFSILFCPLVAIFLSYFRSAKTLARLYVCMLAGIGLYSMAATYWLRNLLDAGMLSVPVLRNPPAYRFYTLVRGFVSIAMWLTRNFAFSGSRGSFRIFCCWRCS